MILMGGPGPVEGPLAELRRPAMGTELQLVVHVDDAAVLDTLTTRLDDLERRWSRFLPESELTAINTAGGAPVIVSPETSRLVAQAIDAWHQTDGLFDPTICEALVAAGYDRSFESMANHVTTLAASPV